MVCYCYYDNDWVSQCSVWFVCRARDGEEPLKTSFDFSSRVRDNFDQGISNSFDELLFNLSFKISITEKVLQKNGRTSSNNFKNFGSTYL